MHFFCYFTKKSEKIYTNNTLKDLSLKSLSARKVSQIMYALVTQMQNIFLEVMYLVADTMYDVTYLDYETLKHDGKIYQKLKDYADDYYRDKNDPINQFNLIKYVFMRMIKDRISNNGECGDLEACIVDRFPSKLFPYIIEHILKDRKKTQFLLNFAVLNYKKYKDFYDRNNVG